MLNIRNLIIFISLLGLSFNAKATHNRAGEITYKHRPDLGPYFFEIKVTTYTNIGGTGLADRCQDTVFFGDGSSAVVNRSNGPIGGCSPAREGVPLSSTIKLNEYITTHNYGGPGTFTISMTDPNRNQGVLNLPNSVNQVFYIESQLVISTFLGVNNSPILNFPPIDKGCTGKCFLHNPGAVDPDGDSLSYELTFCRGTGGQPISGYSYPATGSGGTYNIDAQTGTLTWCTPQLQGEYNLAIIIREWRKNNDGDKVQVGYIIRDMQVDVSSCNNNPPVIKPLTDTCILAGTLFTRRITATDPDLDVISLTVNGGSVISPTLNFASNPALSAVTGTISWQTACVHIRKSPYQITVKAKDNDLTIPLVDFKSFNVTIVAPPPLNLVAQPLGSNVKLTWQKPICQLTSGNKIQGYKIYRKANCTPWAHGYCELGVPASSGFTFIGSTPTLNDITFLDNNNGNGLAQGTNYSYVIYAIYTDGAESYASNQVCVQLKRDVPILVNVDVQTTNSTTGSVFVRWVKPVLSNIALDTLTVTGPYEFRLFHYDGFTATTTNSYTQVYSTTKTYFKGLNQLTDTTFLHTGINTETIAHTYKIEFYANGQFVGSGQRASSVFLSLVPSDNQLTLSWQQQVPWTNTKFRIWKKAPNATIFTLKDSTTQTTYIDDSLVNGALYCYKVEARGAYADPSIFNPLINFSQEACAKPKDTTPPCAPVISVSADCVVPTLSLIWTNPNNFCSDDAVKYYFYSAETENDDLVLRDSITVMSDTIFAFDNPASIAGCYAVSAVDSFGNESLLSAKICVDNCPEYELPNVITVNGDGVNDFFKAIKNKFIKDIDLKIYNRWGTLVYETTDPAFNWDGKVIQSKLLAVEGTYFYVCTVNEIRVSGKVARNLKGFVHVFIK